MDDGAPTRMSGAAAAGSSSSSSCSANPVFGFVPDPARLSANTPRRRGDATPGRKVMTPADRPNPNDVSLIDEGMGVAGRGEQELLQTGVADLPIGRSSVSQTPRKKGMDVRSLLFVGGGKNADMPRELSEKPHKRPSAFAPLVLGTGSGTSHANAGLAKGDLFGQGDELVDFDLDADLDQNQLMDDGFDGSDASFKDGNDKKRRKVFSFSANN